MRVRLSAVPLTRVAECLYEVRDERRIAPGVWLPMRTLVIVVDAGVVVISPLPFDADTHAAIDALGAVRWLVAPNLLHHLFLGQASGAWPQAAVLAPRGLARKRPGLHIAAALEDTWPSALADAIELVPIEGVPSIGEFAFFHRATGSVFLTDLVFNVERPRGWATGPVMRFMGTYRRLGQSREWQRACKDRAAFQASHRRILALPIERLIPAHGEIIADGALEALRAVLPVG